MQLLDTYAAGYSLMLAVFLECIAISWIYGAKFFYTLLTRVGNSISGQKRICQDIREMLGFTPGIFWRVCWRWVSPAAVLASTNF